MRTARQRRRRAAGLLALLACLLSALLTGCWDRLQTEDQIYAITMGVDPGRAGRLLVTIRVALANRLAAGVLGEQDGESSQLVSAEAETLTKAVHILNTALTRRLDLRHLRALIIGEELARSGIEPLVMEMLRDPRIRGTTFLLQARGRAHDIMDVFRPVAESNPARAVEGFLLQAKVLHLSPPVRMQMFLSRLAAPGGDPFLPVAGINPSVAAGADEPGGDHEPASAIAGDTPRGGGNPVELGGTAVYRQDRLVGFLNIDETQMLLALRGEMGKAYVTLPDPDVPGQSVSLRFHQENLPEFDVWFENGRPRVKEHLLFEGELLAAPGGTDYVRPEARRRLEGAAAQYAADTIRGVLGKLVEWGADPVGYGHLFRSHFPNWRAWDEYDWSRHVPDLKVDVTAEMRVRRYGLYTGADQIDRR